MNAEPTSPQPDRPVQKCTMCDKPVTEKFAPFCSKRCADLDLGKWLNGSYVIEGSDSPSSEDDPESQV
jgi:uncharacterized protein